MVFSDGYKDLHFVLTSVIEDAERICSCACNICVSCATIMIQCTLDNVTIAMLQSRPMTVYYCIGVFYIV